MRSKLFAAALSTLCTLAVSADAEACRRCGARAQRMTYTVPYAYAPRPTVQASPQAASTRDPASFVAWINGVRARAGLGSVAWDATLAGYAAQNSSQGFGHHGRGGFPMGYPLVRRENAGLGDLAQVEGMWLASPPHAAALLDPSIRLVGLGNAGNVWTYNAR